MHPSSGDLRRRNHEAIVNLEHLADHLYVPDVALRLRYSATADQKAEKLDAETELRGGAKTELQENDQPDAETELLA